MSIFGQVWLWSLLAFLVGALLTWLVLVLPAQKRIRGLESKLATAHAEHTRTAATPEARGATSTAYLAQPGVLDDPETAGGYDDADRYDQAQPSQFDQPSQAEPGQFEQAVGGYQADGYDQAVSDGRASQFEQAGYDQAAYDQAAYDQAASDQAQSPAAVAEPEVEAWTQEPATDGYPPAADAAEAPATEYIQHPHAEPEPTPVDEAPPTEYITHPSSVLEPDRAPEPVPEPEPQPTSLFQPTQAPSDYQPEPEPDWFDRDAEPERSAFEEPVAQHYAEEPEVTEQVQPPQPTADAPAYAFGSADQPTPGGAESPAEMTQLLPKRQRRESPRGGFDPPQPIQPSMRAVERREPTPDTSGAHSGSLFEPAVQPGEFAPPPEPPPARDTPPAETVPVGPFGPGSAMPRPGGGRPSDDFAVKASVTALRYCTDESTQFPRMVAEVWFRTPGDAERVGFRPLA